VVDGTVLSVCSRVQCSCSPHSPEGAAAHNGRPCPRRSALSRGGSHLQRAGEREAAQAARPCCSIAAAANDTTAPTSSACNYSHRFRRWLASCKIMNTGRRVHEEAPDRPLALHTGGGLLCVLWCVMCYTVTDLGLMSHVWCGRAVDVSNVAEYVVEYVVDNSVTDHDEKAESRRHRNVNSLVVELRRNYHPHVFSTKPPNSHILVVKVAKSSSCHPKSACRGYHRHVIGDTSG